MYLYSGMADVAAETDDAELAKACRRLWDSVTLRRMYVTGGVGSAHAGEAFTFDYDLPNEEAYAETCAAIGLIFFAHRMLHLELDGRYADAMETALYNGALAGVSLDGKRFFYVNPLAAAPGAGGEAKGAQRPEWFNCACCPPNIARLLASLGGYAFSESEGAGCVHLYMNSETALRIAGQRVGLRVETEYPWRETIRLIVAPERPGRFALAVRIPGWAQGAKAQVNGAALDLKAVTRKNYARIEREWRGGDEVLLTFPMPVERVWAHPNVRQDAGRTALRRGPLVYCLEEADNGKNLHSLALPDEADLSDRFEPDLLGGVVTLEGEAIREVAGPEWDGALYRSKPPRAERARIKAIPYYAWANRGPGEMAVWLRRA